MIRVLFVCLGNICRSPMAEFMLKDMVKKRNIENNFYIESRATSSEEIGNPIYYKAQKKLEEYNIKPIGKTAKKLKREDYNNFDYIIGMEYSNIYNILKIIENDPENKVYRLLDFSNKPRDISDPWYTDDFDKAYSDIKEGLEAFLRYLCY